LSIVRRNRQGWCEKLEPDEITASIPASCPDRVRRPADLQLYAQALKMACNVSPEEMDAVVARMVDIASRCPDARAAVRAGAVVMTAKGLDVKSAYLAIDVVKASQALQEVVGDHPVDPTPAELFEGRIERELADPLSRRSIAARHHEDKCYRAACAGWDAAHAAGFDEAACDAYGAACREAFDRGLPAPPLRERITDDRDPDQAETETP
jgi:hypothetical protein